ncbi:hypothetical protein PACTADRAFT_51323 [Pachysolen tannophilus NRRL Y-2460]|uniref:Uncharacterized protein n=1 Tax=Pachysolen tannophilus NRRL Y-2460 TaxID=669874 RepID=A0A1E4TRW2_PACTA|nr:hypothetical protein PACTADRAFT_51323 [Pachysolen tannophilus NRRL Y-2460]
MASMKGGSDNSTYGSSNQGDFEDDLAAVAITPSKDKENGNPSEPTVFAPSNNPTTAGTHVSTAHSTNHNGTVVTFNSPITSPLSESADKERTNQQVRDNKASSKKRSLSDTEFNDSVSKKFQTITNLNDFHSITFNNCSKKEFITTIENLKNSTLQIGKTNNSIIDNKFISRMENLTNEIEKNSPLKTESIKFQIEDLYSQLDNIILAYENAIKEIVEKLTKLDDDRNCWLENSYTLDSARSSYKFQKYDNILKETEVYIENVKNEFLTSLDSIKSVLGI